jgi:hypothetical protein
VMLASLTDLSRRRQTAMLPGLASTPLIAARGKELALYAALVLAMRVEYYRACFP